MDATTNKTADLARIRVFAARAAQAARDAETAARNLRSVLESEAWRTDDDDTAHSLRYHAESCRRVADVAQAMSADMEYVGSKAGRPV